jgi:hypothetical protein
VSGLATVVDTDALLEMLWTATLAGLGVTAAFGLAILGSTRAVDMSRAGRPGEATLYGAMGALAFVAVIAAVVFAIIVMIDG